MGREEEGIEDDWEEDGRGRGEEERIDQKRKEERWEGKEEYSIRYNESNV